MPFKDHTKALKPSGKKQYNTGRDHKQNVDIMNADMRLIAKVLYSQIWDSY